VFNKLESLQGDRREQERQQAIEQVYSESLSKNQVSGFVLKSTETTPATPEHPATLRAGTAAQLLLNIP
jgi:hypothetical protein